MAQDTITNAIFIIAVVIATTVVLTAVYPAIFNAAGTVKSATADADARAATSFAIVTHGFSDDFTQLNIWIKNTGAEKIADTNSIKVYYGDGPGSLMRYQAGEHSISPAGDLAWDPGETLALGIIDSPSDDPLPHEPGTHVVKVVSSNGAQCEYTFII